MPESKEATEFVDLAVTKSGDRYKVTRKYDKLLDDMCEGMAVEAADLMAKKIDDAYEKSVQAKFAPAEQYFKAKHKNDLMEDAMLVYGKLPAETGVASAGVLEQNAQQVEPVAEGYFYAGDYLQVYAGDYLQAKPVKKTRRLKPRRTVEEVSDMSDENKKQNEVDILTSLQVQEVGGRTHLVAIVIDKGDSVKGDPGRNTRQAVKCNHGQAFSEGYPYDQGTDSYMISCVHQVPLGHIPVSYQLTMPGVGDWHLRIPLPEVVVNRYLTGTQRSRIAELQGKYAQPRYVVQIMQMSGCET
jgi:hypothetical protein